ncbi:hypothetical protein MY10362_009196 [Beauveria mimosiformis]
MLKRWREKWRERLRKIAGSSAEEQHGGQGQARSAFVYWDAVINLPTYWEDWGPYHTHQELEALVRAKTGATDFYIDDEDGLGYVVMAPGQTELIPLVEKVIIVDARLPVERVQKRRRFGKLSQEWQESESHQ